MDSNRLLPRTEDRWRQLQVRARSTDGQQEGERGGAIGVASSKPPRAALRGLLHHPAKFRERAFVELALDDAGERRPAV